MFELHIGGAKGGRAALSALIGIAKDIDVLAVWPDVVEEVIHPWFLENAAALIDSGGRLAGENWSYSGEPKYAAMKRARVGHLDVLRWDKVGEYERLYPSLSDPEHEYHYFRMTGNTVSIGTTVPYAHRLTVGGEGPYGEPYPGRSLVPSSPQLNKRLLTYIQRMIEKRIARRGKRIVDIRQNL